MSPERQAAPWPRSARARRYSDSTELGRGAEPRPSDGPSPAATGARVGCRPRSGRSISRLKTNAIAGCSCPWAASVALDRQRIRCSSGLSARDDGQLALSTSCPLEEPGWVRQRRGIDASGSVVTRENITVPLFFSPLMLRPVAEAEGRLLSRPRQWDRAAIAPLVGLARARPEPVLASSSGMSLADQPFSAPLRPVPPRNQRWRNTKPMIGTRQAINMAARNTPSSV